MLTAEISFLLVFYSPIFFVFAFIGVSLQYLLT